jgi:hypothetical protein
MVRPPEFDGAAFPLDWKPSPEVDGNPSKGIAMRLEGVSINFK